MERLQRLLPEFKAAPDLLKERLYIQTMEKVMANTPKVMLDANNGNNLTVLPLEQLMGKKAAQPTTTTPESAISSAPVSTQETSCRNAKRLNQFNQMKHSPREI